MKKIGIITFHRALNYGAILQTYALSEKIKSICPKDVIVEIIDYRNPEIEKGRSLSERLKPFSIKNLLRVGMLFVKRGNFDKFIAKNIKVSNKIYTKSNIDEIDNDYDLVITGSDQVWNYKITNNDFIYMLDVKMSKEKKCSYAASMGLNSIDTNFISKIKSLLSDFNYISVRENECLNILNKELNLDIENVNLDPTLLLTGDEWSKLTINNNNNKYILVYNVPKPDNLYNVAHKVAQATGLNLVYIPTKVKPKNGKIVFPNINNFLTLFSNSNYIITNSFHGTVFSILFHKKMLVELKKDGTGNDRILTLLKICGLEDRLMNENNFENIFNEIDWKKVDKNLMHNRKKSLEYLKKIIK